MATEHDLLDDQPAPGDQPRLVFATELDGPALLRALRRPGVLDRLASQGWAVALLLPALDDARAEAVRLLNEHGVGAIASLCLPPAEGFAFNLLNYPRAFECYGAFHSWARAHGLRFEAVGLSIEPPLEDIAPDARPGALRMPRALLRRLWLARENILYPSAQTAYAELIVAIHLDGYEVYTYQMPVIADDRRAGTSLIQRALDIVDLPSDVDVLMCSSSAPIDLLGNDLGGALIASYGASADAIGVGSVGDGEPGTEGHAPLPWPALRRDLLLAAEHTDTIYVYSLEDCVGRNLLPQLEQLDWSARSRATLRGRLLIGMLRGGIFAVLVLARFGLGALAWSGWVLAIALWLRARQRGPREIGQEK